MDSFVGSSSSTVTILRELLTTEKDETRVWLRAEMDRLVDPLLDTLFSKLETKLTNGLERTQSTGNGNPTEHFQIPPNVQLSQPITLILQPSTQPFTTTLNPAQFNTQFTNLNYSQPIVVNSQSDQSPVPPVSITNQITLPKERKNSQFRPIRPKIVSTEPITVVHIPLSAPIVNEPITEDHFPQSAPIVNEPITEANFAQSALIVNEQSNDYLLDIWNDDDEDCDCNDCVNGGIERIKQENDDSDSVELKIEDEEEEESSRPVKKPRLDTNTQTPNNATQPEVIKLCSRKRKARPTQPNTQVITVHLQCPLLDCPDKFAEDQVNVHMKEKHLLGPFRCAVKDCGHSCDTNRSLGEHIKQAHHQITQWPCAKCAKHFPNYKQLHCHNRDYHQSGHYQCAYPSCPFTGENRKKVHNHYDRHHKPELACTQAGCDFRSKDPTRFKAHERAHLNIKPYRCKWPSCHYASASQNYAMTHISRVHFNPKTASSDVPLAGKPADYLEVVHSLVGRIGLI